MLQKFFSRNTSSASESPLRRALLDRVQGLPFFAPVQLYLDTLEKVRPWWPVLLPMLALVAWRAYHEERAIIAARATSTS